MEDNKKIKSFTDLVVWQEGHKLVLLVYCAMEHFPKHEMFGLCSQMRRAAVSITSNIAEGFSRSSYKEKSQFYSMAHGSLSELENQLFIARDVGYLPQGDFGKIFEHTVTVHKLLNAFIKKTKKFIPNSKFQILDSNNGFTILELIIYLVLFAIVGTLAAGVFTFAIRAKTKVAERTETHITTERVLTQIIERVHAAQNINDASTTLNLAVSDSNKNPTVFSLSGGAVTIKEGAGAAVSSTPSSLFVTSLSFSLITNPAPSTSSVQIKITAGYNLQGSVDSSTLYSLQTTAMPL